MEVVTTQISAEELREAWRLLTPAERLESFGFLPRGEAEEFFLELRPADQLQVVLDAPPAQKRAWMRLLAPDDAADVLQEADPATRAELLQLLDPRTRREVNALLAYEEDDAGGLMSPRYARVRPDMTVDEAIGYLRIQAPNQQHLLGADPQKLPCIPGRRGRSRDVAPTSPDLAQILGCRPRS